MINRIVAVPMIAILMPMTAQPSIMGEFSIHEWLRTLGWLSRRPWQLASAACSGSGSSRTNRKAEPIAGYPDGIGLKIIRCW